MRCWATGRGQLWVSHFLLTRWKLSFKLAGILATRPQRFLPKPWEMELQVQTRGMVAFRTWHCPMFHTWRCPMPHTWRCAMPAYATVTRCWSWHWRSLWARNLCKDTNVFLIGWGILKYSASKTKNCFIFLHPSLVAMAYMKRLQNPCVGSMSPSSHVIHMLLGFWGKSYKKQLGYRGYNGATPW